MELSRPSTPASQAIPNATQGSMAYGAVPHKRTHERKKFVLCFDGTGNKFSGTDADSNILKIYRMLDRNGDDQFHYYQPGIGTYVTKANGSMSRTSRLDKFKSWYAKAKDSAVGKLSFELAKASPDHVHRNVLRLTCYGWIQGKPPLPLCVMGALWHCENPPLQPHLAADHSPI